MVRRILGVALAAAIGLGSFAAPARADGTSPTTTGPSQPTTTPVAFGVAESSVDLSLPADGSAQATLHVTAPADANVTVSAGASWLSVSPASFQGSGTVTLAVYGKSLTPGDVQLTVVTVDAGSAGNAAIPVSVTVAKPTGPALSASPARLDLDAVKADSVVLKTVTLTFAAPLTGVISADQGWLDVAPKTFNNTTSQTVVVKVATANLAKGAVYSGNVEVRSGDYTLLVPVLFKIGNPAPPKVAVKSPFRDVPDDHWAVEAIATLSQLHIINGVGDGRFAPDLAVTREQFARMLVGALQLPLKQVPEVQTFQDVPTDRWSAAYIETVKQYLPGYKDGNFRPAAPATREDMAVALVRAKGYDKEPGVDPAELSVLFTDADKISPALRTLVGTAVAKGIMKGFDDGTFRPQDPLTRAQAAFLFYTAAQVGGKEKSAP